MSKGIRIGVNMLILTVVIGFLYYIVISMQQKEQYYVQPLAEELLMGEMLLGSSYQQIANFEVPAEVNRMEWQGNLLYVVADDQLYSYEPTPQLVAQFTLPPKVRDLAVANNGEVYILFPTAVAVYSPAGSLIRSWEACSELSDYCSIALSSEGVYVTDAANKNICQYTHEGVFQRFIQSPSGFVIPSYAFDIVCYNNMIYCVNSGKHVIERYTLTGDYIDSFGRAGAAIGQFAGCCNPTYLALNDKGEIITSEKGVNRVTKFTNEGALNELLFTGNNRVASEIATGTDGLLFIAQKRTITIHYKSKDE